MDLLANDLSIHGQFHTVALFREAFSRLMNIRAVARNFGLDVYCNRAFLNVEAMPGVMMQQAIQCLPKNEQRSAMLWLTRGGPFWDDLRQHGSSDWLECRGDVVTDSAVGEAAYRKLHAVECGLVSTVPSDWDFSPVEVLWRWRDDACDHKHTQLENFRDQHTLGESLRAAPPPIKSWNNLREISTKRFASLTFAADCFEPLAGVPFVQSAARRILVLLDTLDRLVRAFDETGVRTSEGQQIYQDNFTGDNAWFSDSSDMEKKDFRKELTFAHPNDPRMSLFSTWHGKVHHRTLRLHYSWSGQAGEPLYVVYVGPKITRR